MERHFKVSLELCLLQDEQSKLFQTLLIREVLEPSKHSHGLLLGSLQQLHHTFLILEALQLNAVLHVGLTKEKQSGRTTSFNLPDVLLLLHQGYSWIFGLQMHIAGSLSFSSGLPSIRSPPRLYLCLILPHP